MRVSKNQATVNRLLKKSNTEPSIDMMDYHSSMLNALNWYNINFTDKDKRRWFQEHFKRKIDFPISHISDFYFRTVGTLCRIVDNGNTLSDQHEQRIVDEVANLRRMSAEEVNVVNVKTTAPAKVVTPQERMDKKTSEFLAEFNAIVDEYTVNREIGNVDKLVNQFGVNAAMSKKIIAVIEKPIAELEEVLVGKDKQLVEGYSNFKKTELKKLLEIYRTLVSKLDQAKKIVIRKPRAKKVKPATQLVARLKFCKENTELKLKSLQPVTLIGSTEVWAFNVKYKKLQVYKALKDMTLTVKGSTLLNFDVENSIQKTIRKPEQLADLSDKGKRAYSNFMKAIKTKEAAVTGRFNAEILILAAFK